MEDVAFTEAVLDHNKRWTGTLMNNLNELGLKAYPSQTNFVLVEFPPECRRTADETNDYLNSRGIIPGNLQCLISQINYVSPLELTMKCKSPLIDCNSF